MKMTNYQKICSGLIILTIAIMSKDTFAGNKHHDKARHHDSDQSHHYVVSDRDNHHQHRHYVKKRRASHHHKHHHHSHTKVKTVSYGYGFLGNQFIVVEKIVRR